VANTGLKGSLFADFREERVRSEEKGERVSLHAFSGLRALWDFADVWQIKDFKFNEFGSVARKGVRGGFFGCVAKYRG
jgi:hypothetical protein